MAGRGYSARTKRKGALRPPRFRGSLAGECGSVFRDHLGFQHRIAQLRECSGAILGGVVAFQIHTHGAMLVHIACEQAKEFRAQVTSAAAAQRRYGRWSPREAKKLGHAVRAIVQLSDELRKEDVLGKLSGEGRVPPAEWRAG